MGRTGAAGGHRRLNQSAEPPTNPARFNLLSVDASTLADLKAGEIDCNFWSALDAAHGERGLIRRIAVRTQSLTSNAAALCETDLVASVPTRLA